MDTQTTLDYDRVAKAIAFIAEHRQQQPGLEQVAEVVHLSPAHFQRLFTDWAGVSPKKFLQYLTLQHAKRLLAEEGGTLFNAAHEVGLSGPGRLHDLFVRIEGMTPGEYKNGGEALTIDHHFAESRFGRLLVASTPKGICHLAFADDGDKALEAMQARFPNATYRQGTSPAQQEALRFFHMDWSAPDKLKLHLRGTPFQLKVWETLLHIPLGRLTTYGEIAGHIGQPEASRAVGTAIGENPVAFLIPCHRVIQSTGELSGYRWGRVRKQALIGWESAYLERAGQ
ncbi:MAG: methylated-DNA--[protein]-cysteine S-methyltransferase [Bacteroidetes bacterium]|nr:methylated-DNA--[protein]-cysteine S-methyltransferase [Bacteroidota bacterium]